MLSSAGDVDGDGLSELARQFAAGILKHAPALTALMAPTPNCYHRLKPHTFAPSNISWGIEDRSALVRTKATGDEATHHEMRGASGLANPYLTAAGTLAAGLLGIEGKLKLGPQSKGPSEDDPKHRKLAQRLEQSLAALQADSAFGKMLGPDFLKLFLAVKNAELQRCQPKEAAGARVAPAAGAAMEAAPQHPATRLRRVAAHVRPGSAAPPHPSAAAVAAAAYAITGERSPRGYLGCV